MQPNRSVQPSAADAGSPCRVTSYRSRGSKLICITVILAAWPFLM